ncbi:hypothetical protein C3L33_14846, partial [Rhododendron williamsianum]
MSMPSCSVSWNSGDGVSWNSGDAVSDQFPVGLRVLVVDDDPTCLMILEKMLRNCLYQVTKCNRAEIALSLLRERKNGFDIVLSDVHMPDMDGFKLLEHVGLEMDLPVITDDSKNVVMKGVTHGACDYLIKPVRIEALRNIWQHVVRKRKDAWKDFEQSDIIEDGERKQKPSEDTDFSSSANEGNCRNLKRQKEEEDEEEEDRDDTSTLKKPRVVWSVELHQQFVAAVNQLGIDKAVPKKILDLMNVPGLSRENVASHLQKYRLYLKRLSAVSPHHSGLNNPFVDSISSLNGLDLQALAATGQLPAQSIATLQAAAALDFQGNSFPLGNNSGVPSITSKGVLQEEVNLEMKGSRGFTPSYDIFNELHQQRSQDWELGNVGPTFDASRRGNRQGNINVPPSILVQQQRFSSCQNSVVNRNTSIGNSPNLGQLRDTLLMNNPQIVKAEKLPQASFQNTVFPEQFSDSGYELEIISLVRLSSSSSFYALRLAACTGLWNLDIVTRSQFLVTANYGYTNHQKS